MFIKEENDMDKWKFGSESFLLLIMNVLSKKRHFEISLASPVQCAQCMAIKFFLLYYCWMPPKSKLIFCFCEKSFNTGKIVMGDELHGLGYGVWS